MRKKGQLFLGFVFAGALMQANLAGGAETAVRNGQTP